jgi:hypothetical protein
MLEPNITLFAVTSRKAISCLARMLFLTGIFFIQSVQTVVAGELSITTITLPVGMEMVPYSARMEARHRELMAMSHKELLAEKRRLMKKARSLGLDPDALLRV